jgi:hypothetical protein
MAENGSFGSDVRSGIEVWIVLDLPDVGGLSLFALGTDSMAGNGSFGSDVRSGTGAWAVLESGI